METVVVRKKDLLELKRALAGLTAKINVMLSEEGVDDSPSIAENAEESRHSFKELYEKHRIPAKLYHTLALANNMEYIEDLQNVTSKEVKSYSQFGRLSYEMLVAVMKEYGVKFLDLIY